MRIYISTLSTYAAGCSKKGCLFKQAIHSRSPQTNVEGTPSFSTLPLAGQDPPSNCARINQAAVLITHSASCETQSAAARNLNPIDLNNSSLTF